MSHDPKELKVGQTLFYELHRRNSPIEIREIAIGVIGNKYIYEENDSAKRYPIDKATLQYKSKQYSDQTNYYLTKQEILDIQEKRSLDAKLQEFFRYGGGYAKSTLEQMREVCRILNVASE